MLSVVLTVLVAGTSFQDPAPHNRPQERSPGPSGPRTESVEASGPRTSSPVNVEDLRLRIRDMRKNVLLGGEKVQQAQAEATDFYKRKITDLDHQLDTTQVELTEKRAAYQVSLDRTLGGAGAKVRSSSIREAAGLRAQVTALERDKNNFEHQRQRLTTMIRAVEAHDRERDRLAARLETATEPSELLALPLPPVGLAPDVPDAEAEVILDQELVRDLMSRDERRARQVLFEADPRAYWEMFELRPPTKSLSEALTFPPADLPRQR